MVMIGLYIVDDEISVREGLEGFIDWDRYNIKIVGVGSNGRDAIKDIGILNPNLVITDIKMPYLSGIELANHLHIHKPDIEIIFLSGYDDVEFLKEAIKVEAIDYLFKPFTFQELDKVLLTAISKIERKASERQQLADLQDKIKQSLPYLRDRQLLALLQEKSPSQKSLSEQLLYLELDLPIQANYCVLLISVDSQEFIYRDLTENERQINDFLLHKAVETAMASEKGYSLIVHPGEVAIILCMKDKEGEYLNQIAAAIRQEVVKHMAHSFTIGIGNMVEGLQNLSGSYIAANEAVKNKLYLGRNKDIVFDSIIIAKNGPDTFTPLLDTDKVRNSLRTGKEDAVFLQIDHIYAKLFDNSSGRRLHQLISNQIALDIIRRYSELVDSESIEPIITILEQLPKLETLSDITECLKLAVSEVCSITTRLRVKEPTNLIEKVKQIIKAEYPTNISIPELASRVYLTPNYLCLVFKQEIGMTINDYLTKVRIQAAKNLLDDPKNKIYQICDMVGYIDTSYFTKIFKKYTGVTPSQYRDRISTSD